MSAGVLPLDLKSIFTPPKPIRHSDHPTEFFYGMPSPSRTETPSPIVTYQLPRKEKNYTLTAWSSKTGFEFTKTLVNEHAVFDRHFHKYRKRLQDFSNIFFTYSPVQPPPPQQAPQPSPKQKASQEPPSTGPARGKEKTKPSSKQREDAQSKKNRRSKADVLFYVEQDGKKPEPLKEVRRDAARQAHEPVKGSRTSGSTEKPGTADKQRARKPKLQQSNNRPQSVARVARQPARGKRQTEGASEPIKTAAKQRLRQKYGIQIVEGIQKFLKNPSYYLGKQTNILQQKRQGKRLFYLVASSISVDALCKALSDKKIEAFEAEL